MYCIGIYYMFTHHLITITKVFSQNYVTHDGARKTFICVITLAVVYYSDNMWMKAMILNLYDASMVKK